jgi:hypothetical protein
MTPLVYKQGLWETSGHWEHYCDDMTLLAVCESDRLPDRLPPSTQCVLGWYRRRSLVRMAWTTVTGCAKG